MSNTELRRLENDYRASQSGKGNFNERVGDINTLRSGSKYDIELIKFPADLGNDPSMQHYVSFSINVRGKSKYNTGQRLFEVEKNPQGAQLTSEELSNSLTGLTVAGGAALGGLGGKAIAERFTQAARSSSANTQTGNAGRKFVDTAFGALFTGAGVAGGAAGGLAVAGALKSSTLFSPDTTYRISDVITLYMEERPTVKYTAGYSNKDLGTLAGVLGQVVGQDFGQTFQNIKNIGGEAASAAILGLAKLPSVFGATDIKSIISASSKVTLNPFREVIFESIDFRTFNFKYRLMPRSVAEADTIHKIIQLFKFHMHPELSENRLFYVYPGEFQIAYYFKDKENKYFHKFTPSVLTDLQVDYGGEQFTTFKDGKPNEINLQLTFRETEILTKELIVQGY